MTKRAPTSTANLPQVTNHAQALEREHVAEADEPVILPLRRNLVVERMIEEVSTAQGSAVICALSRELNRSTQSVIRYMEATAQLCREGQTKLLEDILAYVRSLETFIEPIAFIRHDSLDETPLRVRVEFSDSQQAKGQIAKVFVTECAWSMLLRMRDAKDENSDAETKDMLEEAPSSRYLMISGNWSPHLSSSNTGSGTAVAAIMAACPGPPEIVQDMFPRLIHLTERDENGSNLKAARIHLSRQKKSWDSLMLLCSAHKAHAVADKSLSLSRAAISGTVNTVLTMQTSLQLGRLEWALEKDVAARFVVQAAQPLSRAAVLYRRCILKEFLPEPRRARKRAFVLTLATHLNGDWRQKHHIVHHCREGCCASAAIALEKTQYLLKKLVRVLRPTKVCRDNWQEWRNAFSIVGLLSFVHQLLVHVLPMAFPPRGGAAEEDRAAASRAFLTSPSRSVAPLPHIQTSNAHCLLLRLKICNDGKLNARKCSHMHVISPDKLQRPNRSKRCHNTPREVMKLSLGGADADLAHAGRGRDRRELSRGIEGIAGPTCSTCAGVGREPKVAGRYVKCACCIAPTKGSHVKDAGVDRGSG